MKKVIGVTNDGYFLVDQGGDKGAKKYEMFLDEAGFTHLIPVPEDQGVDQDTPARRPSLAERWRGVDQMV